MKTLSFEGFMNDFGKAAPINMDLSIYRDSFKCACGQSHWFDETIDVICQGAVMRIMVICPDDSSYITNLKIKTFMLFKFKGFESLSGTHISSLEERTAFSTIRQYMKHR